MDEKNWEADNTPASISALKEFEMREIELEEEERREMLEAQKMKGKKFKKPQPIKLREIPEIIQPDYAEKNGLVYHIDRITMLSDAVFSPPSNT